MRRSPGRITGRGRGFWTSIRTVCGFCCRTSRPRRCGGRRKLSPGPIPTAVDYPIYRAGEAPAGIFSHNLIILDSGGGNPYAQRIRNRLWMECGEGGVVCQEQTLTGEYIAMQVVPHPYDDRRSVLYVATNSEGLLGGNLFTRRVVHPYYLNGLHPYWNNVALLHIRGAFYRIYEAGGPLEQI